MKRLNITLPEDIERELAMVSNKSRFIAEALKEKLEREKRQRIDKLLVEGYQVNKEEDVGLNQDWESATLENWG